jgi:hypothetical protein
MTRRNVIARIVIGVLSITAIYLWALGSHQVMAHTSTPNTFKTWSTNETLTATDLNGNFAHLHNTPTGNIRDANISTTAAIQHSKLAQPGLLPRAVAHVGTDLVTACNSAVVAACILNGALNITSVSGSGTLGKYNVTLAYSSASLLRPFLVSAHDGTGATLCNGRIVSLPNQAEIHCKVASTAAPTNAIFTFEVY